MCLQAHPHSTRVLLDVTVTRACVCVCVCVCQQVYKIMLQYSGCVQPLSCDEAYIDVTGLGDPEHIAAALRKDIETATGCTASAGMS